MELFSATCDMKRPAYAGRFVVWVTVMSLGLCAWRIVSFYGGIGGIALKAALCRWSGYIVNS